MHSFAFPPLSLPPSSTPCPCAGPHIGPHLRAPHTVTPRVPPPACTIMRQERQSTIRDLSWSPALCNPPPFPHLAQQQHVVAHVALHALWEEAAVAMRHDRVAQVVARKATHTAAVELVCKVVLVVGVAASTRLKDEAGARRLAAHKLSQAALDVPPTTRTADGGRAGRWRTDKAWCAAALGAALLARRRCEAVVRRRMPFATERLTARCQDMGQTPHASVQGTRGRDEGGTDPARQCAGHRGHGTRGGQTPHASVRGTGGTGRGGDRPRTPVCRAQGARDEGGTVGYETLAEEVWGTGGELVEKWWLRVVSDAGWQGRAFGKVLFLPPPPRPLLSGKRWQCAAQAQGTAARHREPPRGTGNRRKAQGTAAQAQKTTARRRHREASSLYLLSAASAERRAVGRQQPAVFIQLRLARGHVGRLGCAAALPHRREPAGRRVWRGQRGAAAAAAGTCRTAPRHALGAADGAAARVHAGVRLAALARAADPPAVFSAAAAAAALLAAAAVLVAPAAVLAAATALVAPAAVLAAATALVAAAAAALRTCPARAQPLAAAIATRPVQRTRAGDASGMAALVGAYPQHARRHAAKAAAASEQVWGPHLGSHTHVQHALQQCEQQPRGSRHECVQAGGGISPGLSHGRHQRRVERQDQLHLLQQLQVPSSHVNECKSACIHATALSAVAETPGWRARVRAQTFGQAKFELEREATSRHSSQPPHPHMHTKVAPQPLHVLRDANTPLDHSRVLQKAHQLPGKALTFARSGVGDSRRQLWQRGRHVHSMRRRCRALRCDWRW
eukprot:349601-Chlamydomonas_euryale.AAC.5